MKSHFRELKWLQNGYDILFLRYFSTLYLSNQRLFQEKKYDFFVMNITYGKCGDYLIRSIIPDLEPKGELGKFG